MRFRGEASPSLPWPTIVDTDTDSEDAEEEVGGDEDDEVGANALMSRIDSIGPAPAGKLPNCVSLCLDNSTVYCCTAVLFIPIFEKSIFQVQFKPKSI